ncbi:MAG: hypothetical protein AMS18_05170 [Gemmatimonas sp. SG8_17]|nr:MAG: hypothetical protein AMS18_05170 [Gemmatimonas sp. SG8_17]
MPGSHNIAVIGVGNRYRSDDAAGLVVLDRLRGRLPPTATVLESLGDGTELLDFWRDFEMAIAVDAVFSGAAPGTVYRFDARQHQLPAQLFRCSTHVFGLAAAVEMGRVLGNLPASLIVYGIEGQSFVTGLELSRQVHAAVGVVSQRIHEDVCQAHAGLQPTHAPHLPW